MDLNGSQWISRKGIIGENTCGWCDLNLWAGWNMNEPENWCIFMPGKVAVKSLKSTCWYNDMMIWGYDGAMIIWWCDDAMLIGWIRLKNWCIFVLEKLLLWNPWRAPVGIIPNWLRGFWKDYTTVRLTPALFSYWVWMDGKNSQMFYNQVYGDGKLINGIYLWIWTMIMKYGYEKVTWIVNIKNP